MISVISMTIIGLLVAVLSWAVLTFLFLTIFPNVSISTMGVMQYALGAISIALFLTFIYLGWKSHQKEKANMEVMRRDSLLSGGLSQKEKVITWLACLVIPVWSGAVLYYFWRKKDPLKAKQANEISFIAFCIWFPIVLAYKYWF